MTFLLSSGGIPRRIGLLVLATVLLAVSHASAQLLDLSSFSHGQIVTNLVTSNGTIVVNVDNQGGGPDLAVIFSTTNTGTLDPDLEGPPSGLWNGGNIPSNQVLGNAIIIEENSVDTDSDGLIDSPTTEPDDEAGGGIIEFCLPTNALEVSFFRVDYEASANNFIVFTDGPTTQAVEFTEFSDTNSPFFTFGVVEADNAANEFVPLNVSDLTLNTITKFWFDLDGSGAINNLSVFFQNQLGSIGDFVWLDVDGDGLQDGGSEIGISNVTINLHVDKNTNGVIDAEDDLVATTVTDSNGLYLFSNRSARAYLVDVSDTNNVLDGLALTGGTDPHDLVLAEGQAYTNADFGYQPVRDLDILKESDATTVTNGQIITYTLTIANTSQVTQTGVVVTDAIPTGTTYVAASVAVTAPQVETTNTVFDQFTPAVYTNNNGTTNWSGGWTEVSDDGSPSGGTIQIVADRLQVAQAGLNDGIDRSADLSGATAATLSFDWEVSGLEETMTAWISSNSAGPFDVLDHFSGQSGSGSTNFDISAYISADTTVRFQNTNGTWTAAGDQFYADNVLISFPGPTTNPGVAGDPPNVASNYTIPVGTNMVVTFQVRVDSPSSVTSIVNEACVFSDQRLIPVCSSVTNPLVPGAVGDFVWEDLDGDGVQDGGEPGISNVTVRLRDANSNIVATTTTDGSGMYLFTNLPPADYFIEVVQPAGFEFTLQNQTNDTIDSDVNTNDGRTATFTLLAAETNLTLDAGLYQPAAIGDFVWDDVNTNGVQDVGEVGVNGVTVRLYRDVDGDGVAEPGGDDNGAIATTNTALVGGTNGWYQFSGLAPGDYFVEVVPPAGFVISPQDAGGDDTLDSDIDQVTGLSDVVTVASGETDNTVDGGIYSPLDLSVSKGVNDAMPGTNQMVLWTISISNLGPVVATGVEYTDILPGDLIFMGSNPSTGVYDSAAGIWSNFGLAVGATAFLEVTSRLDSVTAGIPVTNCVDLTGVDQVDTNAANNSDCAVVIPAWALIAEFDATRSGSGAVVEWRTASEVGTAGFYLEREGADGFERVTPELLPGLINAPQGGTYRYFDSGAPVGAELTYRLVEIEIGGGERAYGPYTVSVAPVYAETEGAPADYESEAAALSAFEAQRMAPVTAVTAGDGEGGAQAGDGVVTDRARILVTQSGVQRLDASVVASALGMTEAEAEAAIAAHELALRSRGGDVPYYAEAGGAALLFYGKGSDHIFCRHRVYWLAAGTGVAMGTLDGGDPDAVAGQTFTATLSFEQNKGEMTRLFHDPASDYYFWKLIVAGNATLGSRSFDIEVPGVAGGPASLDVQLYSLTRSGVADEHNATVSVNGTVVGSETWTGAGGQLLELTVPDGVLVDGSNTVTVTGTLAAGVPYSMFVVDSMTLEYERTYTADNDILAAPAAGHSVLTVEEFTGGDILVLDLDGPAVVENTRIESAGATWQVSFTPSAPDAEVMALTRAAAASPVVLGVSGDCALTATDLEVDYLVITVPELLSAAQALADYRASQGLATLVVTVQEVYDCFSHGEATPYAIKALLAYAHTNWARAPIFVVLAGSGSYDYRDYEGTGDTLVPPLMAGTPKGLFSADGLYGDVAGDDGVPEMMVGRLPARTDSELAGLVQRIQAYEDAVHTEGDWASRILMIADDPDEGGNFPGASDLLIDAIGPGALIQTVYRSELSTDDARTAIQSALGAGVGLANFTGHGAINRLAGEGLLTSDDVAGLGNDGRRPVLTALSCIIGRFEVPGYNSLAETLVLDPSGGAIAVWSPSGLSMNYAARHLGDGFCHALFNDGTGVLGEAIRKAKLRYAASTGEQVMLGLYNLIGCPALKIAGREGGSAGDGSYVLWRRERFTAAELADTSVSGETADGDADGATVIEEYVFGLNPGAADENADAAMRIDADEEDGCIVVSWTRRKSAGDVSFVVDLSTDLSTWDAGLGTVKDLTVTDNGDGVTETVAAKIEPNAPLQRLFGRLRVITP